MELLVIAGYVSAIFIGFTLGLIGGGGSILTVPVLVYLLGIDPVLATAYSLFIVGLTSVIGSVSYMQKGLLSYKTAIVFAVPSFIAVFATRRFLIPGIPEKLFTIGSINILTDVFFMVLLIIVLLGVAILSARSAVKEKLKGGGKELFRYKKVILLVAPAAIMVFIMRNYVIPALPKDLFTIGDFTVTKSTGIMIFFALVMFFSAFSMIKNKNEKLRKKQEEENLEPSFNYPVILIEGLVVGAITGFVGAGGGFLIVPALVLLAKLPMKLAIGTSLLIISAKSLIGFIGDLGNQPIDWSFLLLFTAIAIVGIIIGSFATNYIAADRLKKGFGWFVLGMAMVIMVTEIVN